MSTARRPIIALWALFFITPCFTTNILDYWVATDLMTLSTALIAAAWMYRQSLSNHQTIHTASWALFLLFLCPIFLHLLIHDAANPWSLIKSSIYIASVFLIFHLSRNSAQQLIQSTAWVRLLAWVAHLYIGIGIAQSFHLFPEDQQSLFAIWSYFSDFVGPLLQRNLSTLFLLLVVAALWLQSIRNTWNKRWLLASVLPCAVIIFSNSRAALLLLFVLFFSVLILHPHRKSVLVHLIPLLAISIAIAMLGQFGLQHITGSITPLGSRLAEAGITARLNIWYSAILMFLEHPWIGVGAGNFSSHFADFQGQSLAQHPDWYEMDASTYWSHNIILQFFSEGGILGGIFILAIFAIIGKRIMHILKSPEPLQHPHALAAISLTLLLLHGLVSISLMQGFFLALFGLYLAALFPSETTASPAPSPHNIIAILPALYLALTCYQYIHTQAKLRVVFNDNPDTPRFINQVSQAIENPWLSRSGMEYLFVNMDMTHAPAWQWVQLYPYLYTYWQLNQEPLALKRLILQAHLADNPLSEAHLATIYAHDFPKNAWNKKIQQHIHGGHQRHEALDMQ